MYKHTYNQLGLQAILKDYLTVIYQVNPCSLGSSNNCRPIYCRTNTRKFSMKSASPDSCDKIPTGYTIHLMSLSLLT